MPRREPNTYTGSDAVDAVLTEGEERVHDGSNMATDYTEAAYEGVIDGTKRYAIGSAVGAVVVGTAAAGLLYLYIRIRG